MGVSATRRWDDATIDDGRKDDGRIDGGRIDGTRDYGSSAAPLTLTVCSCVGPGAGPRDARQRMSRARARERDRRTIEGRGVGRGGGGRGTGMGWHVAARLADAIEMRRVTALGIEPQTARFSGGRATVPPRHTEMMCPGGGYNIVGVSATKTVVEDRR